MAKKSDNKRKIRICGYATKWGIAYAQDKRTSLVLKKGAFNESIKKLRKEIPILLWHDSKKPVGRLIKPITDDIGLLVEAEIYDTDTIRHIEGGGIRQFSISFDLLKAEYDITSGIEFILKALLYEVSVVTMGAGQNTSFEIMKD